MKKFILPLLITLVFFSCRKKIEFPSWEVDALIPLAKTTLTTTDMINDTLLKTGTDNAISLVYRGEIFSLDFDSLFRIPDTTISQFFLYPVSGFTINPGFVITNQVQQTKYNLEGVELTKVIIKSGSIDVQLTSYFQGKTLVTYQLPYTSLNGNFLQVTDTLPAATSTTPTIVIKNYDVSGYEFDLRGPSKNSFNTVVSSFKAIALDTTLITPNDSVKIINSMVNIIPEYAHGYFGQSVVEISLLNKAVNRLKNFTGGKMDLKDFSLTANISNGIGVDIRFLLNNVISSNNSSGSSVSLAAPLIGSSVNINRATINSTLPYPPVDFSDYLISLDDGNSNADALIEIFPDSISTSAKITLNPLGNISNSNDFIYYGKGINITLDAEVPLYFSADKLILSDTVGINFGTVNSNEGQKDASDNISGGNIILDVYNGYPLTATPQLILMNEQYQVLDSLVSHNSIIEAAELNADFYAVGKKVSKIYIPVSREKIQMIKQAKQMQIKVIFSTASLPDYIRIYNEYSLDIKVIADISYLIDNTK